MFVIRPKLKIFFCQLNNNMTLIYYYFNTFSDGRNLSKIICVKHLIDIKYSYLIKLFNTN